MRNLKLTVSDLWHISRTALAGKDYGQWDRMQYVKKELRSRYPELVSDMTNKQLWFFIEKEISVF